MNSIANNIADITKTLKGTKAQLVAVSKKQPMDRIQAALDAGQRSFGENRVQEAYMHWQDIKTSGQYPDLNLHLIGPLQSNKAKEAVAFFDVIESIDREKIAKALANEMDKQGRHLQGFIQVNTGEEAQKSGIAPHDLEAFYTYCTQDLNLNITGLMCIPPLEDPPTLHFALLQKYAQRLKLPDLSMGMSGDYQLALPLGATHIRIGTGVFGKREMT